MDEIFWVYFLKLGLIRNPRTLFRLEFFEYLRILISDIDIFVSKIWNF